ncbi:transposable element-related [Anaeramoeba flamelloides]|uniref:Transposable element-related n=1 Tax=Anaeramoeba flamelloides TaxID=1746091 RepID=A0AAV7YFA6_9EUKA|nr:transposable element-related [Anaeramoeba flamelloides]
MSGTSVWRIRKALKFKFKAPKVKPKLTEQSKMKRLEFVQYHLEKQTNWKKVVFTDETWFYLESLNRFIWRQWGENDVNSESYQNNIISGCRVFTDMDKEYGQWNWLLMQDGAPAHTSNSTKEYLSNKCLVLKNWPPNSPDLNPIENLWGIMGKRISKESPNTERKLEIIVRKVWKNIEWEVIENLINSMEKRLRLVVQLNGESIQSVSLLRHKLSTKFKAQKKSQIKAQNPNSRKINCKKKKKFQILCLNLRFFCALNFVESLCLKSETDFK